MRWCNILSALAVVVAATLVCAKVDNIIHEVRFAEVYRCHNPSPFLRCLFNALLLQKVVGAVGFLLFSLHQPNRHPLPPQPLSPLHSLPLTKDCDAGTGRPRRRSGPSTSTPAT